MALPITSISLSNTFGQWIIVTQNIVTELNELDNKIKNGTLTKSNGTFFINSSGIGLAVANTGTFGNIQVTDTAIFSGNTIFSKPIDQVTTVYNFANTLNSQIISINSVNNTQNATINLSFNTANAAYDQANIAYSLANTIYDKTNISFNTANAAYDRANVAYSLANSAYDKANLAITIANTKVSNTDSIYIGTTPVSLNRASNNLTLSAITLTGPRETKVAMTNNTIDLYFGSFFTKTITTATTFSVANVAPTGNVSSFIIDLTNGGSNTVNWFANTKWKSGIAPTLTSSGRDVLGFFTHDSGNNWNGILIVKDIK